MIESGWTAGAAVTLRLTFAGLILLIPAVFIARQQWPIVKRNLKTILLFGLTAMAGMQFFYFMALSRLDVTVALLIEHMAPLLIVSYVWAKTGIPPRPLTIIGSFFSVIGLVLVIGIVETLMGQGLNLDPVGLIFSGLSAVCLALYFAVAARETGGLHPIVMTSGGMLVGAAVMWLLALVGILPFTMVTHEVDFNTIFGPAVVPFWVPLVVITLVAGVVAYTTGIISARLLGATMASFISLTEVLFAALWAWLFISQGLVASQWVGGAIILAGIALIKWDDGRSRLKLEKAIREHS